MSIFVAGENLGNSSGFGSASISPSYGCAADDMESPSGFSFLCSSPVPSGSYTVEVLIIIESEIATAVWYGELPGPEEEPATLTINGQVSLNGHAASGVRMNYTVNGGSTQNLTTGSDGSYQFTVSAGDNVSFWPSPQSPYTYVFTQAAQGQGDATCRSNPPPNTCSIYNIQRSQTYNFSAAFTTVFLLHGIHQSHLDMADLASNLTTAPGGLDLSRFVVDAGFDYGSCAEPLTLIQACASTCTVSGVAQQLSQYIAGANPGNVVLVGFSTGGLVARKAIENGQAVQGLVTLSTPNWGYAWLPTDNSILCSYLLNDMAGAWNPATGQPNILSSFLQSLKSGWGTSSYGQYWLAATGRFCANQARVDPGNIVPPTGCLEPNGTYSNDGVVCADSALYSYYSAPQPAGAPTQVFNDPSAKYAHTSSSTVTSAMMGCSQGAVDFYHL